MTRDDRGLSPLLLAVGAGLVAAIACGVVWGLIVKLSEYEVGFVAWGIGFVVGMAVLFGTRGARGIPYQAVAIVFALLGILLGKYLAFVWVLQDLAEEETGGLLEVPVFSGDTIDLFWSARRDVFSWIDLLWAALAIITAWRILGPEEPEPEAAPPPEPPEQRPQTEPSQPR